METMRGFSRRRAAIFALGCVLAGLAAILTLAGRPGVRRMFYFPSSDERLCTEVRFLPRRPVQGDLRFFVDELLLGPLTDRYRMLFSPGAATSLCVAKDRTLYLDIALKSLVPQGSAVSLEEGAALLEQNIRANFPGIHRVVLFFNGQRAWEYGAPQSPGVTPTAEAEGQQAGQTW
jgi:hypothetical protein